MYRCFYNIILNIQLYINILVNFGLCLPTNYSVRIDTSQVNTRAKTRLFLPIIYLNSRSTCAYDYKVNTSYFYEYFEKIINICNFTY